MHDCYYDPESNGIADLYYNQDHNVWILTRINIPKSERGKGYGTKLLKKILDHADRESAVIVLAVSASDGLANKQLCRWYARHGFRADENPLWTGFKTMTPRIMRRDPQQLAPVTETILQADEIEYLRRNTNRCWKCGHLWLLHRPQEVLPFEACQVAQCDCVRSVDEMEKWRPRNNVNANA
jgi:predicted GNAT family acetyltransferase